RALLAVRPLASATRHGYRSAPAARSFAPASGIAPDAFDVIELNESLSLLRGLLSCANLASPMTTKRVNRMAARLRQCHPLGMSGARITGYGCT
ncbi:hypothetical protein VXQ18_04960, partial [Brucella abortus]|nr:hypothetical protein [Brucella abortus]